MGESLDVKRTMNFPPPAVRSEPTDRPERNKKRIRIYIFNKNSWWEVFCLHILNSRLSTPRILCFSSFLAGKYSEKGKLTHPSIDCTNNSKMDCPQKIYFHRFSNWALGHMQASPKSFTFCSSFYFSEVIWMYGSGLYPNSSKLILNGLYRASFRSGTQTNETGTI